MQRLSDYRWSNSEARLFGKACSALALAKVGGLSLAEAFSLAGDDQYGIRNAFELQRKSGVGGLEYGTTTDTPAWSSVAQGTFDQTVLGRTPGPTQLPFQHKIAAGSILGVGAAWRAEGKSIRVAPVTFAGVSLPRTSVGGIVPATREFFELAIRDNTAAETLARLMRDAIRREVDSVFCGSSAAVAGQQPAGLAYSAQSVSSTGATGTAIAADVRAMVSLQVGGGVPFRSAVWLLSSEAYSLLASLRVIDENGTLAGRPIVTDAPSGTFLLLAADFLSFAAGDSASLAVSTASMIELDTAPTGDTLTPTAAANNRIALFQADSIAVKALVDASWQLSGPTDSSGNFASCVKLTGSSYA